MERPAQFRSLRGSSTVRAEGATYGALTATFAHYRATLSAREAAVRGIDADLAEWFTRAPFADAVARLSAYRGITALGGLSLASEVCDYQQDQADRGSRKITCPVLFLWSQRGSVAKLYDDPLAIWREWPMMFAAAHYQSGTSSRKRHPRRLHANC